MRICSLTCKALEILVKKSQITPRDNFITPAIDGKRRINRRSLGINLF